MLWNKKSKMKGQMSVTNILSMVVIVATFAILLPVMNTFITLGVNMNDATVSTILYIIPTLMAIGIVMAIFRYEQPYYGGGQGGY
jgi:hypothetical protein